MKKDIITAVLSSVLTLALVILVLLVVESIPSKDCEHHICEKTPHEATCDVKGYTTYVCIECGHTFEADFIAPLGHQFTDTVVAPTCDTEGYTAHYCPVCGIEDRDEYVRPTGHSFVDEVYEPTCDDLGYTHYECVDCGFEMDSDYVEPLGHTYAKEYFRPNFEETGYTEYTCTVCDSEHVGDYVFYTDIFEGAAGTGEGALAWGLDLSHHSYDVDFKALKKAGIDFVILRVGYGKSLDTKFESYYKKAKEAGLDVGVYYFTLSESGTESIADAKRIATWLKGKTLEYPVFFDVEDDPYYSGYAPSTFSEEKLMDIISSFMSEMVELGFYPGLYTNNKFLYNLFNEEKTLKLYDVWYARYAAEGVDIEQYVDKYVDEYSAIYSMWQYQGSVDKFLNGAVSGMCDVNLAFKDYPEIMKQFGFNGYQ